MAGRPKLTDAERARRALIKQQRQYAAFKSLYLPGQSKALHNHALGDAPLDQGGETGDNRLRCNLGDGGIWFRARGLYA